MDKATVNFVLWVLGGLIAVAIGSAIATLYLGQSGALGVIVVVAGLLGGKVSAYRKARAQAATDSTAS
jgi:hypothetical protein